MADRSEQVGALDPGVIREGGYQPVSDPGPPPAELVGPDLLEPAVGAREEEVSLPAGVSEDPRFGQALQAGDKPAWMTDDSMLPLAFGHVVRRGILELFVEGKDEMTPQVAARLLKEEMGTVSYHFRWLSDAGIIELARTEPYRGAVVHFYRVHEDLLPRVRAVAASLQQQF